jgi:hypothetical protein
MGNTTHSITSTKQCTPLNFFLSSDNNYVISNPPLRLLNCSFCANIVHLSSCQCWSPKEIDYIAFRILIVKELLQQHCIDVVHNVINILYATIHRDKKLLQECTTNVVYEKVIHIERKERSNH